MKSIIRVPTEQYAYIEVEFEGTELEIVNKSRELTKLYNNPSAGLIQKDFNNALDNYLLTANISEELFCGMSPVQQAVIQELKKAFKRAKKNNIITDEDGILENVEDTSWEHKHHVVYDASCSECFNLKDK